MYTVPVKVTVPTKTFITAIEKGEFSTLHPVDRGEDGPRPLHPELSTDELAQPGTAKKLLLAFETRRQESLTSPPPYGRTPSSGGKLSSNIFKEFETQSSVTSETKRSSVVVVVNHVSNGTESVPSESVGTTAVERDLEDSVRAVTISEEELAPDNSVHSVDSHVEQSTDVSTVHSVQSISVTATTEVKHEEVIAESSPARSVIPADVHVTSSDVTLVAVTSPVDTLPAASSGEDSAVSQHRNVLVVSGVKHGTSLDAALSAATVRTLTDASDDVIVTDVYKLTRDQSGRDDYNEEQKKLLRADLIIFQYRTVLHTVPAAIKAWFENVLSDHSHTSILKGKKSVLLVTTEAERNAHDADQGTLGDINACVASIQSGILRFVGLNVLSPQLIFGASESLDDTERAAITKYWAARLPHIWKEKGLFE